MLVGMRGLFLIRESAPRMYGLRLAAQPQLLQLAGCSLRASVANGDGMRSQRSFVAHNASSSPSAPTPMHVSTQDMPGDDTRSSATLVSSKAAFATMINTAHAELATRTLRELACSPITPRELVNLISGTIANGSCKLNKT